MSSSSDKELEQQLLEAGNKLAEPSSSVDELLPVLDVSHFFWLFEIFSFEVIMPCMFVGLNGVIFFAMNFVICLR